MYIAEDILAEKKGTATFPDTGNDESEDRSSSTGDEQLQKPAFGRLSSLVANLSRPRWYGEEERACLSKKLESNINISSRMLVTVDLLVGPCGEAFRKVC